MYFCSLQVVNNLDESKAEIDLNQEGIAAKFDDNEKAEDKEIDKVQNDDENGAYDFISDDEWEPMTVTSNEDNKETGKTQTLDMADVDWSVLETNTEKGKIIRRTIHVYCLGVIVQSQLPEVAPYIFFKFSFRTW